MATPTYDLLASVDVSASTSSISFTGLGSLSADYRDLVIVGTVVGSSASRDSLRVYFNSDTGANYSRVNLYAYSLDDVAVAKASDTASTSLFAQGSDTAHYGQIQIFDFNKTDKHKSFLNEMGALGASELDIALISAQRWANTAAITTIDLTYATNTVEPNSEFYLYGIKA